MTHGAAIKKLGCAALLAALLCAILSGMICTSADTSAATTQYVVNTPLDVYISTSSGYVKVFTVPTSYYVFAYDGSSDGGYTAVEYGNFDLDIFVRTSELASNAAPDDYDLSEDANNGAFAIANVAVNGDTASIYLPDLGRKYDVDSARIEQVFGIFTETDTSSDLAGTYLFARIAYDNLGEESVRNALIPVNQTDKPGLSLGSVPPHHQEQAVVTPPEDDELIDTPSDPSVGEPGQSPVVRNIMIAIICVLCVVVIFLIFKPSKRKSDGDRYSL